MDGKRYLGIPREQIPWAPKIDTDKCTGCGQCLEFCPNNVYAKNEESGKMEVARAANCVVLCDKCKISCPQEAITFPDKQETKELIQRLLRETREKEKDLKDGAS